MCGIAGILNLDFATPPLQEEICRMISVLRYRGPDESGVYLDPFIALGHLRLSIIGLDDGTQPLCNENGTLWIVYNGEAFNYIELKEELVRKGHYFSTKTDTEVILHLYEEYGAACLDRINGQYSFALWDSVKKELFLARDRLGVRPIYYANSGGRLLFASEIKAILAVDGSHEINLEAISQVFTFWTTLQGKTAFNDIHELPAGHYLKVNNGQIKKERYWSIPFYPPEAMINLSLSQASEELHDLLKDAVRIRLRADVPVGAYLSGGLDSSIIAMLIARNFKNSFKTFSIGFQEDQFDESAFQDELIGFLKADHRRAVIKNNEIRKFFPKAVWHCEKPLLRTAPVPMLILSNLVQSEGLKVVLSGEGADELFGGYNIFKEAKIRHFWGKQPASAFRPLLLEKLYPFIFRNPSRGRRFMQDFFAIKKEGLHDPFFSHRIRWGNSRRNLMFLSDESLAALAGYNPIEELATNLPPSFYRRDLVSRAQVLEMELFLSNYLLSSQGDRVAMAHSVELRHPFLDYRVIDFAFRLPAKWKISGLNEKFILKRTFSGLIPDSIGSRPKQPYRAPIRELFSNSGSSDYVDELLSPDYLKKTGYFNQNKVSRLLEKYRRADYEFSSEFQNMALMGILSTQILYQQFVEGISLRPTKILPDKIIQRDTFGC